MNRPAALDSYQQRFGGLGRLYGADGLGRLRRSHLAVIGLGGVGSWAAEALARSGIGELTLIDLDASQKAISQKTNLRLLNYQDAPNPVCHDLDSYG